MVQMAIFPLPDSQITILYIYNYLFVGTNYNYNIIVHIIISFEIIIKIVKNTIKQYYVHSSRYL